MIFFDDSAINIHRDAIQKEISRFGLFGQRSICLNEPTSHSMNLLMGLFKRRAWDSMKVSRFLENVEVLSPVGFVEVLKDAWYGWWSAFHIENIIIIASFLVVYGVIDVWIDWIWAFDASEANIRVVVPGYTDSKAN